MKSLSSESPPLRFLALLICLSMASPPPALALREANVREKEPGVLAGLEGALQSGNPNRLVEWASASLGLPETSPAPVPPVSAAGLEEVPIPAIRLALSERIPPQVLQVVTDPQFRELYGKETLTVEDVLQGIEIFKKMPHSLKAKAEQMARVVADVIVEVRSRYESRLSEWSAHMERVRTLIQAGQAQGATEIEKEIHELGVTTLATPVTPEESVLFRGLDRVLETVQERMRADPPLPTTLETALRKWQYHAVAVLSASGALSEGNAVAFLQDPSSWRFSAWVRLGGIFKRELPDESPLGISRRFWTIAYTTPPRFLRLDDLTPSEREQEEMPVGQLFLEGVYFPDALMQYLEDLIGEERYPRLKIAQTMASLLQQYGQPPLELMRDVLLRRPEAVWNLAALQEQFIAALSDRLGETGVAVDAAWDAYGLLNRSHRQNPSYPRWWMKIPVPPFTGNMGWRGRLFQSRPFDLLYVTELIHEQFSDGKNLREALQSEVLASEMRAAGVTPEDFIYILFSQRGDISELAGRFEGDSSAQQRLAFLGPLVVALVVDWQNAQPGRSPTPDSVRLAFHQYQYPDAGVPLSEEDEKALIARMLEVLVVPEGGRPAADATAGLEGGEKPGHETWDTGPVEAATTGIVLNERAVRDDGAGIGSDPMPTQPQRTLLERTKKRPSREVSSQSPFGNTQTLNQNNTTNPPAAATLRTPGIGLTNRPVMTATGSSSLNTSMMDRAMNSRLRSERTPLGMDGIILQGNRKINKIPAAGLEGGQDEGAQQYEPDWSEYAGEIKRILYPASGIDFATIGRHLLDLPFVTDVYLEDMYGFPYRTLEDLHAHFKEAGFNAVFGGDEERTLAKRGTLDLKADFHGRAVNLRFRQVDFLTFIPSDDPMDLTIVHYPGAFSNLAQLPAFWRQIINRMRPGGLISLSDAFLPPKEVEDQLDLLFAPKEVSDSQDYYRSEGRVHTPRIVLYRVKLTPLGEVTPPPAAGLEGVERLRGRGGESDALGAVPSSLGNPAPMRRQGESPSPDSQTKFRSFAPPIIRAKPQGGSEEASIQEDAGREHTRLERLPADEGPKDQPPEDYRPRIGQEADQGDSLALGQPPTDQVYQPSFPPSIHSPMRSTDSDGIILQGNSKINKNPAAGLEGGSAESSEVEEKDMAGWETDRNLARSFQEGTPEERTRASSIVIEKYSGPVTSGAELWYALGWYFSEVVAGRPFPSELEREDFVQESLAALHEQVQGWHQSPLEDDQLSARLHHQVIYSATRMLARRWDISRELVEHGLRSLHRAIRVPSGVLADRIWLSDEEAQSQLQGDRAVQELAEQIRKGSERSASWRALAELRASEPGPDARLHQEELQKELRERLRLALSFIPPRQREMLKLRYGIVEARRYSSAEVAGILGISQRRVEQTRKGALRALGLPYVHTDRVNPEILKERLLTQGPKLLPERDKQVLRWTFGIPNEEREYTFEEIGQILKVERQAVQPQVVRIMNALLEDPTRLLSLSAARELLSREEVAERILRDLPPRKREILRLWSGAGGRRKYGRVEVAEILGGYYTVDAVARSESGALRRLGFSETNVDQIAPDRLESALRRSGKRSLSLMQRQILHWRAGQPGEGPLPVPEIAKVFDAPRGKIHRAISEVVGRLKAALQHDIAELQVSHGQWVGKPVKERASEVPAPASFEPRPFVRKEVRFRREPLTEQEQKEIQTWVNGLPSEQQRILPELLDGLGPDGRTAPAAEAIAQRLDLSAGWVGLERQRLVRKLREALTLGAFDRFGSLEQVVERLRDAVPGSEGTTPAAGLEARWEALRSAAPGLKAVVMDEALVREFPALERLAGLEERFFVDRPPTRAKTVWALYELGVEETLYYGGLEAADSFKSVARGLVEVTSLEATAATLYRHLLNILSGAGIPDNVLAAGLEQFTRELQRLSPEA